MSDLLAFLFLPLTSNVTLFAVWYVVKPSFSRLSLVNSSWKSPALLKRSESWACPPFWLLPCWWYPKVGPCQVICLLPGVVRYSSDPDSSMMTSEPALLSASGFLGILTFLGIAPVSFGFSPLTLGVDVVILLINLFLPVFVVPNDLTTSTGPNKESLTHADVVASALVNCVIDWCLWDVIVDGHNPMVVGMAECSNLLNMSSWKCVFEVALDWVDLDPLVGKPKWNPNSLQESFRTIPK